MALVDRTAYPRLPSRVSARELAEAFTPTVQETSRACAKVAGPGTRLALLVMLKCYQRLGYFPGWSGCRRRWSSTSTLASTPSAPTSTPPPPTSPKALSLLPQDR
jgi:hypothetical protein